MMAGEVSVVSVLANVLVAPATAPVTILGLIAAIFATIGIVTRSAAMATARARIKMSGQPITARCR